MDDVIRIIDWTNGGAAPTFGPWDRRSNRRYPIPSGGDTMTSADALKGEDQGLHVRPVRHGGRHAERADRGRRPLSCKAKGWTGQAELVRHLVAAHALRELDDRRAAAQGAHALSRDRPPRGRLRAGARRHRLHRWTRSAYLVAADRDGCEPLPGGAGGAGPAADALQARRALQRRSRHAGGGQAVPRHPVRPRDLGGRGELLQAARRDLHQGRRDHGRAHGRGPVRRQPRLRLHRRQGGRHAHGLHRPPPAALRRHAASARSAGRRHELACRSHGVTWDRLEGVRILDLSPVVSGPFGSMQLGDLGADVTPSTVAALGEFSHHRRMIARLLQPARRLVDPAGLDPRTQ